jgi:4-hydroxy-tetrahydrodipicolinate reductase
MDALNIAICGAEGRMGTSLQSVLEARGGLKFAGGFYRDSDALDDSVDLVIDFSSPAGCMSALQAALEAEVPFVTGTTGLSDQQDRQLREAGSSIPVLLASNFSVGINILTGLVEQAAEAAEDFDIEIFEAHHRKKVDAPSGTALSLGEAAAGARDLELEEVAQWGRKGDVGVRDDETIGFQVVRGGSIVGEHTVMLCGDDERLELTHRAEDRSIFAKGALRASAWLVEQPPGFYDMRDVLF